MNKKLVYIFVVLVLGLFVISACQSEVGSRMNQNGADGVMAQINANSCKADDICEISFAQVNKGMKVADGLDVNDGGLIVESGETLIRQTLSVRGTATFSGLAKFANGLNVDSGKTTIESSFTLTQLSGEGNAYACLDSNGKLYRSNNACR